LASASAKLGYSQLAALFEASAVFMRGADDFGGSRRSEQRERIDRVLRTLEPAVRLGKPKF
jgi:hypothetical protein